VVCKSKKTHGIESVNAQACRDDFGGVRGRFQSASN
jgi:hypothetical protein